jgi:hypothetical protein
MFIEILYNQNKNINEIKLHLLVLLQFYFNIMLQQSFFYPLL